MEIVHPHRQWAQHAACRGKDPNLWQPHRGEFEKIRAAKETCAGCPVLDECRQYGLWLAQHFDTYGIFGGMTRHERFTYLRNRRIPVRSIGATGAQTTRRGAGRVSRDHGTLAAIKRHAFHGEPLCTECAERKERRRIESALSRQKKKNGSNAT